MSRIDHTFVDLDITVCGVSRTVEARVEYVHTRAFAGTVEHGSGVITQQEEPENAEIQRVTIYNAESNHDMTNIIMLLTDEQLDAISTHILED